MAKSSAAVKLAGKTKNPGPVSDLERHLPAEWWRTLFNSLYPLSESGIEADAATEAEVDRVVRAASLEAGARILDLCCGNGRRDLALARRGFADVTGIDRSRYLIRVARRGVKESGLSVAFQQGDARKYQVPEGAFDCVLLLGNTFTTFDRRGDNLKVLRVALRALRSGGTLALDLPDGDWLRENFEKRSWDWIDQNHLVARERSLPAGDDRLISRVVLMHAQNGVIADQLFGERLYTRDGIADILSEAGFLEIQVQEVVETDIGEGAPRSPRLFVTARAPRREIAPRRPPFPEVTVILGDPRLAEPNDLEKDFSPEDMESIERMKAALAELTQYSFSYIDDHATLLAQIAAHPPAFALNFCDNGYRNNADQELHVPALLDILGIPYSGSGPTCLGMCYDKALVRALASAHDVPVPLETFFDTTDHAATIPSVFPALIKPSLGDGSVGITKDAVVHNAEEMLTYLDYLRAVLPGRPALVQEFLTGPEYGVGLIGNPGLGFTALPPLEVDYSGLDPDLPPILSYESKNDPTSPYWTEIKYHEARIPEGTRRRMVDYATLMFERLGCRDYARFDFRADADGEIKLLEVNPNPAWCWDGKLNFMAGFAGRSYAELLGMIIDAAQARVASDRAEFRQPARTAASAAS